jgi:hypothetical protein
MIKAQIDKFIYQLTIQSHGHVKIKDLVLLDE